MEIFAEVFHFKTFITDMQVELQFGVFKGILVPVANSVCACLPLTVPWQ